MVLFFFLKKNPIEMKNFTKFSLSEMMFRGIVLKYKMNTCS